MEAEAIGSQKYSERAQYTLSWQCGGRQTATFEVWAIIHNCSRQKVETAKQNGYHSMWLGTGTLLCCLAIAASMECE